MSSSSLATALAHAAGEANMSLVSAAPDVKKDPLARCEVCGKPEFSTWEVVGRLLQNAFFKAILPGFEPERSPKTPRPSRG